MQDLSGRVHVRLYYFQHSLYKIHLLTLKCRSGCFTQISNEKGRFPSLYLGGIPALGGYRTPILIMPPRIQAGRKKCDI